MHYYSQSLQSANLVSPKHHRVSSPLSLFSSLLTIHNRLSTSNGVFEIDFCGVSNCNVPGSTATIGCVAGTHNSLGRMETIEIIYNTGIRNETKERGKQK
jgi:hypothetical protein